MLAFLVAAQTFVADRFDKKSDRGATAVEYGLIVAGIAIAIVVIVFTLGDELFAMFNQVTGAIQAR